MSELGPVNFLGFLGITADFLGIFALFLAELSTAMLFKWEIFLMKSHNFS